MVETDKPTKRGRGQPKKQFDLEVVEKLGTLHCTMEDMAGFLGADHKTVEGRMRDNPDFAAAYKRGLGKGQVSLRRRQFEAMENGSVAMMIWLGKQWLGQTEKIESVGADAGENMAAVMEVIRGWKKKIANGSTRPRHSRATG